MIRKTQNTIVGMEQSDRSRRPVRRVMGTGSGALVAYPSFSEPITSIPHVSADFSRMNNSYGAVPNNGHMQRIPYTQTNHAPHMPNNSSVNVQKPNDSYFNQILEKHKKDLTIMFKENFGIELKDKTLVCQKSYP